MNPAAVPRPSRHDADFQDIAAFETTMLDSILKLTCEMLDASCQHEEPAQRQQAYAGPLWDRKLPGSKAVVPFIRDFARAGGSVRVALNDRPFATLRLNGQAEFDSGVLSVPYIRQLMSGPTERNVAQVAASVHEKAPALLAGKWTPFGVAQVRIGHIIPVVSWENDDAVFRWDDPPGVMVKSPRKGFFGLGLTNFQWTLEGAIKEIRIGEFEGRVEFTRRIFSLLAPDLEWA